MGTFPFVSAHQRVTLSGMCRQFTGVVPEPLWWPCLPACRSQLVTGRWLLDSSPVSTSRTGSFVRAEPSSSARALGTPAAASLARRQPGAPGCPVAGQRHGPLQPTVVSVSMERKQGASAEPGRRRRRQEAKQTGRVGGVRWEGLARVPLPGWEEGESVLLLGACKASARPPARVGPVREWDQSGRHGGAGALLLGDLPSGAWQPHGNPRPASVPVQLGGAGWLRSDHSLGLPADPSSPASAASFCSGPLAFPQCGGDCSCKG